jgi:hypothetical protein
MACRLRRENQSEKDKCESCGNSRRTKSASPPPFHGSCCMSRYQSELQGVLCRACGNTLHTTGALQRSNPHKLVPGQVRRTRSRAFPQSMQASASRRIFTGLRNDAIPRRAPYGRRYRHQKFWMSMENSAKNAMTIAAVSPKSRKR